MIRLIGLIGQIGQILVVVIKIFNLQKHDESFLFFQEGPSYYL